MSEFSLQEKCFIGFVFISLGVVRGTTPLMLNIVTKLISPELVITLRSPFSVLLYMICMIFAWRKEPSLKETWYREISSKNVHYVTAVMGLCQQGVPFVMFAYSVSIIGSGPAGVMLALTPLLSCVFTALPVYQKPKKVPRNQWIGLFLGLFGVSAILIQGVLNPGSGQSTSDVLIGYTLSIIGVLMWAFSSVFWSKNRGELLPLMSGLLTNFYAGIWCTCLWLVTHFALNVGQNDERLAGLDGYFYFAMLWITLMSGFYAILGLYWLFNKIGPVNGNATLYIVPIVSLAESVIFENAWSDLAAYYIVLEIIGVILVLAGLYVNSLPNVSPTKHPAVSNDSADMEVQLTTVHDLDDDDINDIIHAPELIAPPSRKSSFVTRPSQFRPSEFPMRSFSTTQSPMARGPNNQ